MKRKTLPAIMRALAVIALYFTALHLAAFRTTALEPIPAKIVVLTFDDSVASHHSVVRPILKRYAFGATFFITEGFSFPTNKQDYMTWEQIRELHQDGFEIGNHTRDHMSVSTGNLPRLAEQIEAINARCKEYGIPRPVSFAYPGNSIVPGAVQVLKQLGIRFARRGGAPEHPYEWGRGFAYEPGADHPLLIPSAGDARPDWTLNDFKRAADQASGESGRIAVLQFHGVPDRDHPWVHSEPARFEEFMRYLHTNNFKVIALRDLARYVDPEKTPDNPLAIIEKRKAERKEVLVEGAISDDQTGQPLPARIYIQDSAGAWYFPKTAFTTGSSIRYERRNNPKSFEMHTTLSAHPFRIELQPGRYTFTIHRGKEFFPETREVTVENGMPKLAFRLKRWISMNERGWYSGDTHNHRAPADLPNVMLAEDVNVGLPMTDWTTVSTVAPSAADRVFPASFGDRPVHIDPTHVWHPRSTEYEIFRTGNTNHTLGALLILNHRTRFDQPVFPLQAIAEKARKEGALLDLEKHNWPWSLALVPLLNIDLYELANNHHWQTEYAIRSWAVPAPAYMGLSGSGTDNERDWTLFGFQTYYALLNSGFRLRPAAGTANGVHPVPLGFGRVYVQLDGPFNFDEWMRGLNVGRSFVTTGPMILARANEKWPGEIFKSGTPQEYSLECTVLSEQPLESIELIVNGEVAQSVTPQNKKSAAGSYESTVSTHFSPQTTSWLAWRCFEKRPNNRFRFAHTAPWHFEIPGKPLRPRRAEADWLVSRVKEEIARSQGIAPETLIDDYKRSLRIYEDIARTAR